MKQLREAPFGLGALFDEAACPHQLYDLCLLLIDASDSTDTDYACRLWDIILSQVSIPSHTFLTSIN